MSMIALLGNLAALSLAGTAPTAAPAKAETPRHTHSSPVTYRLPEQRQADIAQDQVQRTEVKVPLAGGTPDTSERRRALPELQLADGSAWIRMRANGLRFNWEF